MLALEIRLLTDRFAAESVTQPGRPEWPPHPARVYSALTAALHEDPESAEDERLAMEWLASAGAPEIIASEAATRQLETVFVPTNDQKPLRDIDGALEKLAEAEAAFDAAEGKERAKAERRLQKAHEALVQASRKSTEADGSSGAPANAAELLNRRLKPQPRRFPVAVPHESVVHLRWATMPEPQLVEALDRVAARVARLGHSSSLVSVRVVTGEVERGSRALWKPDERGRAFLRVPMPGQLARLEAAHERHRQVEQRVLPADQVRYLHMTDVEADATPLAVTTFASAEEDWIVFEAVPPPGGGRRPRYNASLAEQVARAMRGTLLRQLDPAAAPEALTGHDVDGRPTREPHLAFVPLPFVGHPFASGDILGVALIPPRGLSARDRDLLLEAIYRAEREAADGAGTLRLTMGWRGELHLRRLREPSRLSTLTAARWVGPARRWDTATAIALSRNPGKLFSRDPMVVARAVEEAEASIAEDCVRIGLPAPAAVWVHRRSNVSGAPAARRFMPFPYKGDGHRRVCVHAEILFEEPVEGPLMLGAGRFFGLGLCVPRPEGYR